MSHCQLEESPYQGGRHLPRLRGRKRGYQIELVLFQSEGVFPITLTCKQHLRVQKETRSVADSNLIGTFFCTQAIVPTMLKAKSGAIINISSLAAVTPGPFSGFAYGAAKAGDINFTEFLNTDLRNTSIRASIIIVFIFCK